MDCNITIEKLHALPDNVATELLDYCNNQAIMSSISTTLFFIGLFVFLVWTVRSM